MASSTSIHLPKSRSAVLQRTSAHSLFRGRKFLKLLKSLTVGQAVPEIPLSVGSKLELHVLLRAFVFAKFPYTSPYTHAFVRVCTFILPCIFICVYINYISYVHCIYPPRVLHFSAFITHAYILEICACSRLRGKQTVNETEQNQIGKVFIIILTVYT